MFAPGWEYRIELLKTPEGRLKQQQISVLRQQAEASGLDPDDFIAEITDNDHLLIKNWSEVGDWWALCAGDMEKVQALCRQHKWTIKDQRSEVPWPDDVSQRLKMVMPPRSNQPGPFKTWVKAGHGIFKAAPAFGKAQPVDEVVLTPTGWRTIGSVKIGDLIIGSDGLPCHVTGVFPQGQRPVRTVRFSDGASVRVDVDHLWAVKNASDERRKKPWRVLTTHQVQDSLREPCGEARWKVPLVEVQGDDHNLPLDPYVIGVLIGDGCLAEYLCSPTFTSVDEGIVQAVNDRLPVGYRCALITGSDRAPSYRISRTVSDFRDDSAEGPEHRRSEIKDALKDLRLWGCLSNAKFIPARYLMASAAQRRDLLAGLMDTDGWHHGSQLSTVSEQLALDVVQLARSLGGTARLSKKKTSYVYQGERRRGQDSYMVTVKVPFTPFLLERKKQVYENHPRKPPCRKVVAVEDAGTADCVCISVDAPDQLYVTRDYVVTHNTYIMVWYVTDFKQRTLFLTHTDQLAEQFIQRFRHGSPRSDGKGGFLPVTNCLRVEKELGREIIGRYRGPDTLWPVTVATWQSFISPGGRKSLKALKQEFGLVLCDEAHVFAAPAAASVVNGFAAKQKRGVTATPKRKDQLDIALYDILGQVTAEGKSDQLPVAGYMISTGVTYKGRTFPGMGQWAAILNFLYKHAVRNDLITKWIVHDAKHERKILVLGERRTWILEMAETLKKEYGISAKAVVGGVQGARRDSIISEMTTGDLQVLLCTTKIGREGLDIPVLDTLYATMPLANKSGLEQMLGRERRPHPAKTPPVIFRYFVDEGAGQLYGCAKATHRHLLDEGAEIHLVEVDREPEKVTMGAQAETPLEDGVLDPVPRKSGLRAAASRSPSAVKKLFTDLKEEARLTRQYNERMGKRT